MEEITVVLHGVGVQLTACLGVQIDQVAIAIEFVIRGWQWIVLLLGPLVERWEQVLESLVSLKPVLELSLQSLLVLDRWLVDNSGVEVVELDVSDTDCEVVLLLNFFSHVSKLVLKVCLSSGLESGPDAL